MAGAAARRVCRVRRRSRSRGSAAAPRAGGLPAHRAGPGRSGQGRAGRLAGARGRGQRVDPVTASCSGRVRGVVQGVGFRPFVFRLALANTLAGWVLNEGEGVEIHLEGGEERLRAFLEALETEAPAAAAIAAIDVEARSPT